MNIRTILKLIIITSLKCENMVRYSYRLIGGKLIMQTERNRVLIVEDEWKIARFLQM